MSIKSGPKGPSAQHLEAMKNTDMRKHLEWMDADHDGKLTVGEVSTAITELGLDKLEGTIAAPAASSMAALATAESTKERLSLTTTLDKLPLAKHASGTDIFDKLGRFDEQQFEKMWESFDKDKKGYMTLDELHTMIDHNTKREKGSNLLGQAMVIGSGLVGAGSGIAAGLTTSGVAGPVAGTTAGVVTGAAAGLGSLAAAQKTTSGKKVIGSMASRLEFELLHGVAGIMVKDKDGKTQKVLSKETMRSFYQGHVLTGIRDLRVQRKQSPTVTGTKAHDVRSTSKQLASQAIERSGPLSGAAGTARAGEKLLEAYDMSSLTFENGATVDVEATLNELDRDKLVRPMLGGAMKSICPYL